MARRNESPEDKSRRELVEGFLKENPIKDPNDVQALMKEMIRQVLQSGLSAELDEELGYTRYDYRNKETENSRNGFSKKTMHTSLGDVSIDVPRDRDGDFEPQLVQKHQNTLTQDIEAKIISMYAKGMTTGDIETNIRDLYGIEMSDSTISRVTDKILPIAKEWQSRPLEEVYAVVFMDAIHYHVRSEGQIIKKAVYIAIDIQMDGIKNTPRFQNHGGIIGLNCQLISNIPRKSGP